MNIWQYVLLAAVTTSALIWPSSDVQAMTVSGRASTVVEWYDNADGDTSVPFYQYLLLNVRDIDNNGLNFKSYGRFADDLADEEDADSRLYYAYLEKKNVVEGLDFKLGRQFISTTAGASVMDGLYVNYEAACGYGVKLFGGGDVSYYKGYSATDLIGGLEVYGQLFDSLDIALSYLQKWDESELSHELFGLNLDYTLNDTLNLYSETQFNYLSNSVSYFLVGANYLPTTDFSLRAEYLYSLPVFSSTSIYSVFAVEEYEEMMAELSYSIMPGLRSFIRGTLEKYDAYDDAVVLEAGIEKIRKDRFSGYLVGTWRDDEEGEDLYGIKARAAYLITPKFQAGVGAHIDVLERELDYDDDETTASRVWVDGTCYFTRDLNLEAKVERIESDLYDEYYSGRVRLNVHF
jgi:hypothetical protein